MRGRPGKLRIRWNRGESSRREASSEKIQEPEDYVDSEWDNSKSKSISRSRGGCDHSVLFLDVCWNRPNVSIECEALMCGTS